LTVGSGGDYTWRMQHLLQVSRKIDYGLRAMIYLSSMAEGSVVTFRDIAKVMHIPEDFLAKILKTLVNGGLVRSTRGAHGGYSLARAPADISFLEVIEAVEGPVQLNLCMAEEGKQSCDLSSSCTMYSVWRDAQDRMLEVYRSYSLAKLAMKLDARLSPLRVSELEEPAHA
jgi:Rrf2 family protein